MHSGPHVLVSHIVQSDSVADWQHSICALILTGSRNSLIAAILSASDRIRTISGVPAACILAAVVVGNIMQPTPLSCDGECALLDGATLGGAFGVRRADVKVGLNFADVLAEDQRTQEGAQNDLH